MNIAEISEEKLLNHPHIRYVDFEHEWYFVAEDLNIMFMGAFQHIKGVPLPILIHNDVREIKRCISYRDIQEHVKNIAPLSDFEQKINTALNFDPRKKL